MSTKLALAVAALVAALAAPALANDYTHGRVARHLPANTFASARMAAPVPAPVQTDFQLQGRF